MISSALLKRNKIFSTLGSRQWQMTTALLAAGLMASELLFFYGLSLPVDFRVRGDAIIYLRIADKFRSWHEAFSYTGDRTYGFPLFLFAIKYIFLPRDPDSWAKAASCFQFALHILASLCFYALCLKDIFKKAGLPALMAPLAAALIMTYPALVTYTFTPLTDTFCADILMIAVALHCASRKVTALTPVAILCILCGLLLGYTIVVRPSFWPSIVALYAASIYEAGISRKARRSLAARTMVMLISTLLFIAPTVWHMYQSQGTPGLQNKEFVETGIQESLQNGLSAVRVFWPDDYIDIKGHLPGIRDPLLDETYGKTCRVDSIGSLAVCLLSHPLVMPFYFGKKTIALFDIPDLETYAVGRSPVWFKPLERLFAAVAFCGFISLVILAAAQLLLKQKPVWIGLPWSVWALILMAMHLTLHIEGRYSLGLVPLSLTSLFLGFAGAREAGNRFFRLWLSAMVFAAALFFYQVYSWDAVSFS